MKRNAWIGGVPADGHPILIATDGSAHVVREVAPYVFELVALPDPPEAKRRRSSAETYVMHPFVRGKKPRGTVSKPPRRGQR